MVQDRGEWDESKLRERRRLHAAMIPEIRVLKVFAHKTRYNVQL